MKNTSLFKAALLSIYLIYYLQVQQACFPGNPLENIIFQIDRCEDVLYTQCQNVGYAVSALQGSVEILLPEGRYAFRIEDPRYKPERKTAMISYGYATRIFYLYPPLGKCQ